MVVSTTILYSSAIGRGFKFASAELKLSASPGVKSNAQLEAHLIPQVSQCSLFKLTTLSANDLIIEQVEIGLTVLSEAQANIFLNLDAAAIMDLSLTAGAEGSVSSNGSTGSTEDVEGCIDIKGEVSINAGATGSFFDLFDATTSVPLFDKTFELFSVSCGIISTC